MLCSTHVRTTHTCLLSLTIIFLLWYHTNVNKTAKQTSVHTAPNTNSRTLQSTHFRLCKICCQSVNVWSVTVLSQTLHCLLRKSNSVFQSAPFNYNSHCIYRQEKREIIKHIKFNRFQLEPTVKHRKSVYVAYKRCQPSKEKLYHTIIK